MDLEGLETSSGALLKQGLEKHLGKAKNHVVRLKQVFRRHGQEGKAWTARPIDGIIEEADDITGEVDDKSIMDALPSWQRKRWNTTQSCCSRVSMRERQQTRCLPNSSNET